MKNFSLRCEYKRLTGTMIMKKSLVCGIKKKVYQQNSKSHVDMLENKIPYNRFYNTRNFWIFFKMQLRGLIFLNYQVINVSRFLWIINCTSSHHCDGINIFPFTFITFFSTINRFLFISLRMCMIKNESWSSDSRNIMYIKLLLLNFCRKILELYKIIKRKTYYLFIWWWC